jgi:hypothetical protein
LEEGKKQKQKEKEKEKKKKEKKKEEKSSKNQCKKRSHRNNAQLTHSSLGMPIPLNYSNSKADA